MTAANSKDNFIEEIDEYVSDKLHKYAIAVIGEWGSGKTHFITQTVIPALQSKGLKAYRISLYGVSSVDEFYSRMLSEIIRSYGPTDSRITNLSRRVETAFKSIAVFLTKKYNVPIPESFGVKSIVDLAVDDKYVFFLDDIERRSHNCDDQSLFGTINNFIECQNAKIVFISNSPRFGDKQDDNTRERLTLEKMVWKRLPFASSPSEIVEMVFQPTINTILGDSLQTIVTKSAERAHCCNARAIIRTGFFIDKITRLSFLNDGSIPIDSRKMALSDASYFALLICMENEPVKPERPAGNFTVSPEFMDYSNRLLEYEMYDKLSFINDYFAGNALYSDEELDLFFQNYISCFYPINSIANLTKKLRDIAELTDADLFPLISAYCDSIRNKEFPVQSLFGAISAYYQLKGLGFSFNLEEGSLIDSCESIIRTNPPYAIKLLSHFDYDIAPSTCKPIVQELLHFTKEQIASDLKKQFEQTQTTKEFSHRVIDLISDGAIDPSDIVSIMPSESIVDIILDSSPSTQNNILSFISILDIPITAPHQNQIELIGWLQNIDAGLAINSSDSVLGNVRIRWIRQSIENKLQAIRKGPNHRSF